MSVAAPFFSVARRNADKIAVITDERTVRYGELSNEVGQLSNALAGLGLEPGDTVTGLLSNRVELIALSLTCSLSGYMSGFINIKSALNEIIHVLNLSQAKVLVFDSEFAETISLVRDHVNVQHYIAVGNTVEQSHNYQSLLKKSASQFTPRIIPWETPHSIHFTSGTTGLPKGVVLAHRNWQRICYSYMSEVELSRDPSDVTLVAAPLSHAASMSMLPSLLMGRQLTVLRQFDAERVAHMIAAGEVTAGFMAPTMVQLVMQHYKPEWRQQSRLKSVQYGGSSFPTNKLREAIDLFGPVFAQGFGQWESPMNVTTLTVEDHAYALAHEPELLASAGRPVMLVDVAILDDDGNELPPGEVGEIATCGPHVMLGYYRNDAATQEIRHGRWQRMGDVGHMDERGYLFVTDRKKDMIITGGMNVYPRQVEEVLHEHPALQEVCVVGLPDELWGETVHVVASLRPGSQLSEDELVQWSRSKLKSHQRVRSVRFVEQLPKNAYGKILRRQIRDLEKEQKS